MSIKFDEKISVDIDGTKIDVSYQQNVQAFDFLGAAVTAREWGYKAVTIKNNSRYEAFESSRHAAIEGVLAQITKDMVRDALKNIGAY